MIANQFVFYYSKHCNSVSTLHIDYCDCLFRIVGLWRTELAKTNEKAAESIADPSEYENLFPELSQTLQAEKVQNLFPVYAMYVLKPLCFVDAHA